MLSDNDPNSKRHFIITVALLLLSLWATLLTVLSLSSETLRSPVFTPLSQSPEPSFYIGVSVYITIGATLLTTVAIRIALRISK